MRLRLHGRYIGVNWRWLRLFLAVRAATGSHLLVVVDDTADILDELADGIVGSYAHESVGLVQRRVETFNFSEELKIEYYD